MSEYYNARILLVSLIQAYFILIGSYLGVIWVVFDLSQAELGLFNTY